MEIIYIDSFFLINLLADYLLCLFSARICGAYLKRWRYFAAALLGAAYSVSALLPGMGFLAAPAVKLAAALLMGMAAFGGEERPLRCTGVFLAVSATFGGALYAMGLSGGKLDLGLLLVSFTACYLALSFISRFRARQGGGRVEVELELLGRRRRFMALMDTGNCLTDPLTGARVMIVSPAAIDGLFGQAPSLSAAAAAVELVEAADKEPLLRGRLRLISYSAIGGKGLLPLFRPDALLVDGKEQSELLIAISPQASGEGFQGIL